MELVYCQDCHELAYAPHNEKGVFDDSNASFNHHGHRLLRLDRPLTEYTPPIRTVLMKLDKGIMISDAEIILFKLAIDLGDLTGAAPTEKTTPTAGPTIAASRQQPKAASAPLPKSQPQQLSLF